MTYILYNPIADSGHGEANARKYEAQANEDIIFWNITSTNIRKFFESASPEDKIVIAGGDGTLNCLINTLNGQRPAHSLWYFPAGSGNDFMKDVEAEAENGLILLDPYLESIPSVTVNGETRYFLNGVGYGIDGYCCQEGDKQRQSSDERVNYAAIAIKGMMGKFKPSDAVVSVDGEQYEFKKVWLAPTMNGRYYGGGMMVAPDQNRLGEERTVSLVVMHGSNKLKTLCVFPGIFTGKHIRHTEMVTVLTGHEISVAFSSPTALQIDGETVPGVSSYSVCAGIREPAGVVCGSVSAY